MPTGRSMGQSSVKCEVPALSVALPLKRRRLCMSPVDEIRKTLSQAKETRLKILELCDSIYKQVSRTGNPTERM